MKVSLLLIFTCLIFACKNKHAETNMPVITNAAYYWKTQFTWSEIDTKKAGELHLKRLYIRYLDVVVDSKTGLPKPNAINQNGCADLPESLEAIPVIYLTNEVFQNQISEPQLTYLSEKLCKLILQLHGNRPLTEVQLDCDWTQGTSAQYFRFIELVKAYLKCRVSVTLRLWQFRHRIKSGIPPANAVCLMIYNIGNPRQWEEENSIATEAAARAYFPQKLAPYPLHLDIALAQFRWGVHYRAGKLHSFVHDITHTDLQNKELFLPLSKNRFEVQRDTFISKTHLLAGDRIRFESVSHELNSSLVKMVAPYLANQDSIFHVYYDFQHMQTSEK
jgi:hypothetical protein